MKNAGLRIYMYAISNLAVMFAAYFTLAAAAADSRDSGLILLLFAVLSFGQRMAFGTLADRVNDLRPLMLLGMFLTAWGAFFFGAPVAGAALAGAGSALFAPCAVVGAIRSCPGHTGAMGVFIFMGLIGAGAGAAVGLSPDRVSPPLVVLFLLVCMVSVWITGPGAAVGEKAQAQKREPRRMGVWSSLLSFLSIAIIAYILTMMAFTPIGQLSHLNLLGKAAPLAAGAVFGGLIARKLCWNVVCPVFIAAGGLLLGFGESAFPYWLGLFALSAALPPILCAGIRALPGCVGLGYGFMVFGAAAGLAAAVITDMGLIDALHPAAAAFAPALITLLAYPAIKGGQAPGAGLAGQEESIAREGTGASRQDIAREAGTLAEADALEQEVILLGPAAGAHDGEELSGSLDEGSLDALRLKSTDLPNGVQGPDPSGGNEAGEDGRYNGH